MLALPFRKIIGVFAVFLLLVNFAQAQQNWQRYDMRKFNLGFLMGVNYSFTRISYGELNYANKKKEGLREVNTGGVIGINLGMINNVKILNNWDFRFIPSVSLQQRSIDFVYKDHTDARKIESAYIDLPVLFKFKSDYIQHHRVYVAAGFKYSINLVSDKKVDSDPNLLKIERTDYSLEFAFGVDIYADRVKLAPEIRYSLGFKNIAVPDSTPEGAAVRTLNSHSIMFLLNFE